MSNIQKIYEEPTLENTVMKPEQISTKPIYVNKSQAAELFGVSRSTIYQWSRNAEESGEWPGLSIRPSSTITLLHLETLERFIKSKNKSFL